MPTPKRFVVMSSKAYNAFTEEQKRAILGNDNGVGCNCILHTDLSTIEELGGGSARCMMSEIFF